MPVTLFWGCEFLRTLTRLNPFTIKDLAHVLGVGFCAPFRAFWACFENTPWIELSSERLILKTVPWLEFYVVFGSLNACEWLILKFTPCNTTLTSTCSCRSSAQPNHLTAFGISPAPVRCCGLVTVRCLCPWVMSVFSLLFNPWCKITLTTQVG